MRLGHGSAVDFARAGGVPDADPVFGVDGRQQALAIRCHRQAVRRLAHLQRLACGVAGDAPSRPIKSLARSGAANAINPTAPAIQAWPRTNTLAAIANACA